MKRSLPQELSADDGMSELRNKIKTIIASTLSHEERGAALRALMTAKPEPVSSRSKLPPNEFTSPWLEGMPVEIIDNITNDMDVRDFAALRSASPVVSAKSLHCFTRCFFVKRVMRLEWESMRRMLLILSHEYFGSALKELNILVCPEEHLLRSARQTPRSLVGHGSRGGRMGRTEQAGIDAGATKAIDDMLDRIFCRITQLQCLRFSMDPKTDKLQYYSGSISQRAVGMVLTAIGTRSVRINSLIIGGKSNEGTSHLGINDQYGQQPESFFSAQIRDHKAGLKRAFASCMRLELTWPNLDSTNESPFDVEQLRNLFPNNLFELVPNLEILDITHHRPYMHDGMDFIEPIHPIDHYSTFLPKLRAVSFHTVKYTPRLLGAIKKFRSQVGPNVTELHLHDLFLHNDIPNPRLTTEEMEETLKNGLGIANVKITWERARGLHGVEFASDEDEDQE